MAGGIACGSDIEKIISRSKPSAIDAKTEIADGAFTADRRAALCRYDRCIFAQGDGLRCIPSNLDLEFDGCGGMRKVEDGNRLRAAKMNCGEKEGEGRSRGCGRG
jgi:hypothetical protein